MEAVLEAVLGDGGSAGSCAGWCVMEVELGVGAVLDGVRWRLCWMVCDAGSAGSCAGWCVMEAVLDGVLDGVRWNSAGGSDGQRYVR
jgi:hypothetical protein